MLYKREYDSDESMSMLLRVEILRVKIEQHVLDMIEHRVSDEEKKRINWKVERNFHNLLNILKSNRYDSRALALETEKSLIFFDRLVMKVKSSMTRRILQENVKVLREVMDEKETLGKSDF